MLVLGGWVMPSCWFMFVLVSFGFPYPTGHADVVLQCWSPSIQGISSHMKMIDEHSGSQAKAVILKRHVSHVSSILHFHAHCDSGEPRFTHCKNTADLYWVPVVCKTFSDILLLFPVILTPFCLDPHLPPFKSSCNLAAWLSTRIDFFPSSVGNITCKFLFNKNPLPPRIHIDNFDMKGPAFSTAFGEALQKGKTLDSAFGCEK